MSIRLSFSYTLPAAADPVKLFTEKRRASSPEHLSFSRRLFCNELFFLI
ncbi:hypothetical protein CLOSYM_03472 [[Clostridium] symbiosum ATCC 14940]|uniref:Uncharacterized protein n=1 Tax=[Clostridium] symbiosum ATCC 14940 TaxID=411472 RepID=A0ABC9TUG8_CLOSY|nr:hypothetical protein CLOSYM_03472 [[Clostridium] symbiosum ATCC 14940]